MRFSYRQEIQPNQDYGSVEALLKLAALIERHEIEHSCAVEIETFIVSIVADREEDCVPLEGDEPNTPQSLFDTMIRNSRIL